MKDALSRDVAADESHRSIEAAEQQLIQRCLQGDDAAWESLFHLCQRSLLLSIKLTLGAQAADEDLVNEIAAQVWLWLVESDRRLKNFDPHRGRLTTYLAVLARESVRRLKRSERRREFREAQAGHDGITADDMSAFTAALGEFLPTLTPKEREFCEGYLLASPVHIPTNEYSPDNVRQLRHRVFVKLKKHLAG